MISYKVVVNQQTKQYIIKPYGIKWMNFILTPELISAQLDQFTETTPTLEDEVILAGGKKATVEEVLALVPASNPEIYIGTTQPANTFKLWIDTSMDDVDILRAIRDANPQSTQLAALFDDMKDPHTEWWDSDNLEGVLFGDSPLLPSEVSINNAVLPDILDPNKVYFLRLRFGLNLLGISGLTDLFYLNVGGGLTSIDISTFANIQCLGLYYNALTSESIESILHYLVLFNNPNTNHGNFLDLTGGTNAVFETWTTQSISDYDILISRYWNITYNSAS